ncbi:MAG: O-antigen ligase family protein [Tenuifilaceae bacterium]|jgi:O-antigen ligase|nr:O-antigen ligase family protein [Bacteroidales bacterium]MDI9517652.1 O-antigen ligase family protein [Bacteroidota bacterium]NLH55749.1 tetratricopeptide repeat protein [Rikenellaceae bacterium]OQC63405.1 MAG: O-Antigen ligase [Bacteroidetes bacterium ADurb.Bin008]HNV82440.1 O-antigen ligase family protein [Tenuifilaceae bacterium]
MSRQLRKREAQKQQEVKTGRNYPYFIFTIFIVLLLPVIYYQATLDLTTMPRVLALSAFLGMFVIFFFNSKWYKPEMLGVLRHGLFPVFGLWLVVSVVTLAFSSNPIEGIFDIIKVLFTITIAMLGAMIFSEEENWLDKLAKVVVLSAIVTSLVGFVQYYLWVVKATEPFLPDGRKIIYRVVGVMAHKNLYSLSLFMMLPFVAYGVAMFKKHWKILSIIALVFVLLLIFMLQARATWVGIMVAVAISVITLILYGNKFGLPKKWKITLITLTLMGAVAVGGVLFLVGKDSQNQYVKQLQSIINPKSAQNIHRINIWKTTLEMIQDRPVLGFGPNNWKLHAGYYFKGRFFLEDQINWQRPHNDFLWVFAEKGIFGILLYLAIFGFSLYYLYRIIGAETTREKRLMALLLIFGLVGYLTASTFDFPYERIFHQAFLGVIFACSVALYHSVYPTAVLKIKKDILVIPLVVIFVFGAYYGYRGTKQEVNLNKARAELRIINRGILPRIDSLPENQKKNAAAMLQQKWREVLKYALNSKTILKNLDPQANPIDYYIGLAYLNLKDYQNGLKYCLLAHNQHPGSIKALNSLGAIYYNLKQYDKAEEYLQKSITIFPSHDALLNLSSTYFMQKEYDKAYELLSNAPKDIMSPRLEDNLKSITIMREMAAKEAKNAEKANGK